MCSGCSRTARRAGPIVLAVAVIVCAGAVANTQTVTADPHVLRVCADPNNLPFSDAHGAGFENAIASLVARELGRRLEYFWQPQRRGFLRTTIQAHRCDVVMSVPSTFERVRPTRPYYRSTYVFVTRRDRHLDVRSFDDSRLRGLRIGIQITGQDYDNPPPAQALAARQLVDRIRGYTVYGDYSQPSPQRAIVDAVAAGDVDVAIVWGPLAGYFAAREHPPLAVTPVAPSDHDVPFAFDISMAVRPDDAPLHDALDAALARRASEVTRILRRFGVPLCANTWRNGTKIGDEANADGY
jgi:quinoprotein dehydrogenase-associated probable ABC transporter substrate-binding protein